VGFVVDKVALGHVFLQIFRVSSVNIIPPCLSILLYFLGRKDMPFDGRISET
jgi:hypothetical protein